MNSFSHIQKRHYFNRLLIFNESLALVLFAFLGIGQAFAEKQVKPPKTPPTVPQSPTPVPPSPSPRTQAPIFFNIQQPSFEGNIPVSSQPSFEGNIPVSSQPGIIDKEFFPPVREKSTIMGK